MALSLILDHRDILEVLLLNCEIETLESVIYCNSILSKTLNSPHILKLIALKYNIDKSINSFSKLVREYYHRFDRSRFTNKDNIYHLLWAVIDNDNNTIVDIINNLEEGDYEMSANLYKTIFEAGCRNNKLICDTFGDCDIDYIYLAGMAYSKEHRELLSSNSTDLDCIIGIGFEHWTDSMSYEEFCVVAFEAVRGNNMPLVEEISNEITEEYYESMLKRAILLGYIAADNVEIVKEKLLEFSDEIFNVKVPIIEDNILQKRKVRAYCIDVKSGRDDLIAFALYYESDKVLDYLADNYKPNSNYLAQLLMNILYEDRSSPDIIYLYEWINTNSTGEISEKLKQSLWEIAVKKGKYIFAAELKIHINEDKRNEIWRRLADTMRNNTGTKLIRFLNNEMKRWSDEEWSKFN